MRIIRGRKAVVTGAASGIGRAIALALATEGAALFLIDRDADGLAHVAAEAGPGEVHTAICDLRDPDEITATLARVRALWGNVHILVNCAGIACFGHFHLTAEERWRQVMAINLLAPMQITHELLPCMRAAEEAHILNVCSFLGLLPVRRLCVYQASKYGLVGFTLALRGECHRDTFGVTALCPGFVRTPMIETIVNPLTNRPPRLPPRFLTTTPEAVAAVALASIRRNRALVVITPLARMSWWFARLSPGLVNWINREGWRRRGRRKAGRC